MGSIPVSIKKKIYRPYTRGAICALVLCCAPLAGAQDPVLDWIVTNPARVDAVAIDGSGNVYTAGVFRGTIDFDPGPGTFELTAANDDLFVRKLDADGEFVWAGSYGTTGNGNTVTDVAVDSSGAFYVTGDFSSTADFDPTAGTFELTSGGSSDIYVLKLDSDGGLAWARSMGGTGADEGSAIAVDSAGNVYTTGHFSDTVDFDPGAGTSNLTSGGGIDAFVSKLDASGDFVWAVQNTGTNSVLGNGIDVDSSGNVYSCGRFASTVDLDPGAGTESVASNGSADVYVQKLDSAGTLVWAARMGGNSTDSAGDLVLDTAGNIYTTGGNRGNGFDFDPGTGTSTPSNSGLQDIFVTKWDSDSNFIWGVGMGGTFADFGLAVSVDADGNVYTAGTFGDTVDFDPGVGTTEFTSAGAEDGFVLKLDSTGAFVWARAFGDSAADAAVGVAVANDDNLLLAGTFRGTVDFDPTAGTQDITATGNPEGYAMQLRNQFAPVANDDTGAVDEDAVLTVVNGSNTSVLANDTDDNASDTLTVSAFDAFSAQGAAVAVNADGTFTYDPTGAAALQALNEGGSIADTFAYTVTDGIDTDTATVTVTVNGADEDVTPPVFSDVAVDPAVASPGDEIAITFSVSESLLGDPAVTINGNTAIFFSAAKAGVDYTYTHMVPEDALVGPATIAITGTDLAGNPGTFLSSAILSFTAAMPLHAWPALIALLAAGAAGLRRRKS